MIGAEERHVSDESMRFYLRHRQHIVRPIEGSPSARLDIDPLNETLSIEVEWDGRPLVSIDAYEHISARTLTRSGTDWACVTIRGSHLFLEGYPLLRMIADEVQLNGRGFNGAVLRSLDNYKELLSLSGYLSAEREIGLFGELMVLGAFARQFGGTFALDSWRGGDLKEEHDFGLLHQDIEVKTTSTEGRLHRIGSLQQLSTSYDRSLWFVSIHITRGGANGVSLPEMVDRTVALIGADEEHRFLSRVEQAGVRPHQPRHTYSRWALRTRPRVYRVEHGFPRLTREILESADVPNSVESASYQIDLGALPVAGTLPSDLKSLEGLDLE